MFVTFETIKLRMVAKDEFDYDGHDEIKYYFSRCNPRPVLTAFAAGGKNFARRKK